MRTEAEIQADAKPERPFSNHSEYEVWASRYCYECVHDDANAEKYCPILGVALLGGWPQEWTRARHEWTAGGKSGSYEVVDVCTEFEERRDPGPGDEPAPEPEPDPVCEGQLDVIDAYLDTAIGELSKAPEVSHVG